MPRQHMDNPPLSAEGLNIVLDHPFGKEAQLRTQPLSSGTRYHYSERLLESPFPNKRIEITSQPNRPGNIKVTERMGDRGEKMLVHDGTIDREDSNELLRHMDALRGLPTDPEHDIYGMNERLSFSHDGMWDNGAEEGGTGQLTDEARAMFRDAVDSIESLARMKAKRNAAI